MVAWVLLALTVLASLIASSQWYGVQRVSQRQSFENTAEGVSATIATAIRRDADLTATLRTLLEVQPDADSRVLKQWFDRLDVANRYPGSPAFGFIERVPDDGVAGFVGRLSADPMASAPGHKIDLDVAGAVKEVAPAGTSSPDSFQIIPAGRRAVYCLPRMAVGRVSAPLPPNIALDFCSIDHGSLTRAAETGSFGYFRFPGEGDLFVIVAPVYSSGATPRTAGERSMSLRGWVAAMFNGKEILRDGLAGRSGFKMTLRAAGDLPAQMATLRLRGARSTRSYRRTFDADGRWNVTIEGSASAGPSPMFQASTVLAGGVLMSLLLFAALQTLARSRLRALASVREKSSLLYQATHDPLTKLPNRAATDARLRELEAAAFPDAYPAVLYIDLDGFKGVNDRLSHAAGDELLCEVAYRLLEATRQNDCVGRIGGDEFLVIMGEVRDVDDVCAAARRIVSSLSAPYALSSGPVDDVSASVGIALGRHGSPSDLVREADAALQVAKRSGKDRYVLADGSIPTAVTARWDSSASR